MIKEQDLHEAIAECQGEKNPNANTCIKLAAYYTILNNMKEHDSSSYSFASEPTGIMEYNSGSEFSQAVSGMKTSDFIKIMDELMDALQVLMPKLYYRTLEKIRDIY